MPSPAFLIEGQMEKLILQSICPGVPIRRIGCNGEDVAMDVMAKFIDTHIQLLNNRHYPIVIVFDREGRVSNCDDLRNQLSAELNNRGFDGQYIIGVPDRMIENWILADKKMLESHYGVSLARQNYEGMSGGGKLKEILKDEHNYHKTTMGVELFLKCDPQIIYQKSKSFRDLVDAINFQCPWFEAIGDA